ncbi:MAG: YceI family protein [Verrucomicrobiota bacterium]
MRKQNWFTVSGLLTVLALASCAKNPADDVAAAKDVEGEVSTKQGEGTVYQFTEDSVIEFIGSKVTGSHEGGFKTFSGTFKTDGTDLLGDENAIEIAMNSTWSDNEKLTGHLMSPDFFNVEAFPTSTFQLLTATPAEGADQYTMVGKVTLHGVTKQISFPAKVYAGENGSPALDAEFSINRQDYGIKFPGKPDDLIRDEVVIKLAMRSAPA